MQTNNSTGLAVVTQLQPITVIFPIPEDDLPDVLPQLNAGTQLEVSAYDRANIKLLATGRVAALDSQIDTTTGTVKVRAQFDNSDNALFPNQFVNAQLLVKTLNNVVTVPTAAIQRGAPGSLRLRNQRRQHGIGAAGQHRTERRPDDRSQFGLGGRRACRRRRHRPAARRCARHRSRSRRSDAGATGKPAASAPNTPSTPNAPNAPPNSPGHSQNRRNSGNQ